MRQQCIEAVARAAGRTLNQSEIDGIEQRINENLKNQFRMDPAAANAMSQAERLQKAAEAAAQQLVNEKAKAKTDIAQQIVATQRNLDYVNAQAAKGMNRFDAIRRLFFVHPDAKSGVESVEQKFIGIRDNAVRQMGQVIDAIGSKYFGFWSDPEGQLAFQKEIRGEDSGQPQVKAAAAMWQNVAESLRVGFNDAGGNVKQRGDWAAPQSHSQERIAAVSRDQWINDTRDKLDRSQYVHSDGTRYSDAKMDTFLSHAYDTLSTDGVLGIQPGKQTGSATVANRGSESRQLHFKDGQSYTDYQKLYGEKNIIDAMMTHIDRVARDTATLKVMGPNAEAAYKFLRDQALVDEVKGNAAKTKDFESRAARLDREFDFATGRTGPTGSPAIAKWGEGIRALSAAARLAFSPLTAIGDSALLHLGAMSNGMSQLDAFKAELATYNPFNFSEKEQLTAAGHGLESMLGALNRFGDDALGKGTPQKISSAIFVVNGLHKLDAARKRATGAYVAVGLGKLSRQADTLAALDPVANRNLLSAGVTEPTWQAWRAADLDTVGNAKMLSADAIMRVPDEKLAPFGDPERIRRDAVTTLLGFANAEAAKTVPTPGWKTQSAVQNFFQNPQRGTVLGEGAKMVMQFKGFPTSIIANNWGRMMGMPTAGGKALYGAAFLASTTLMGAITLQLKALANGSDPRPMNDPRFAMAAFLQGGSLGLYGDFMFAGVARGSDENPLASLFGVPGQLASSAVKLTVGQINREAEGKDFNGGIEAVKVLRGFTPATFYTKTAMDHLVFQQLQEMINPGYNDRIAARNERLFGQTNWWEPGQMAPSRSPDLSTLQGQ